MTTTTHTVEVYHIYADTREDGRRPFTYLVYGPYAGNMYDVEVHEGHVPSTGSDTYITTVSDLPRNTHIVADMWPTMDAICAGTIVPERGDDEDDDAWREYRY